MPIDVIIQFVHNNNNIIIIIHCGCGSFLCMCVKNIRATCRGRCALNLDVAIGWEASGLILDCFRCVTGVSCTKVLHSFDEAHTYNLVTCSYGRFDV